jgi:hypothetical protein
MTAIDTTSNFDNNSSDEFRTRTYAELSKEFKELYPKATRAYQLIPLMYNRLTLIDCLSDKEARLKIANDHKQLPGFSHRNVRRHLPLNNPKVPHRVRPSRPKNSIAEADYNPIFSINEHTQNEGHDVPKKRTGTKNAVDVSQRPIVDEDDIKSGNISTSSHSDSCSHTAYDIRKQPQLQPQSGQQCTPNLQECSGCKDLTTENRELKDALKKATAFTTANDTYVASQVPDTLDFEVSFSFSELASHMTKLNQKEEVWVSGKIDKNNRRVISRNIGRLERIDNDGDSQNE